MIQFALNPALKAEELAPRYAADGRLQIQKFLSAASAEALLRELEESVEWKLTANNGERIIDFSAAAYARLTEEQKEKLEKAVILGGRYGFQFRYETIRLSTGEDAGGSLFARFRDFLCSPDLVQFMRAVTGADIDFADAHASRYQEGHFLTAHDDHIDAMERRAAYVMNLSSDWRTDWGGLLLFQDEFGNVTRGYTPSFNSLNLFKVPQRHSVSWVTPLAERPRYAVTGWLRGTGA